MGMPLREIDNQNHYTGTDLITCSGTREVPGGNRMSGKPEFNPWLTTGTLTSATLDHWKSRNSCRFSKTSIWGAKRLLSIAFERNCYLAFHYCNFISWHYYTCNQSYALCSSNTGGLGPVVHHGQSTLTTFSFAVRKIGHLKNELLLVFIWEWACFISQEKFIQLVADWPAFQSLIWLAESVIEQASIWKSFIESLIYDSYFRWKIFSYLK